MPQELCVRSRVSSCGHHDTHKGDNYAPTPNQNKNAQTKCKSIVLDEEPTSFGLRKFRMDLKEAGANALQHDPNYAYRCIQSVEEARCIEDLAGELTYPAFEAESNTALRNMKKTTSLRNKFNSVTERWQADGKGRVMSLQLLWIVYGHLKHNRRGEALFNLGDLMKVQLLAQPVSCTVDQLEVFIDN